MNAQSLGSVKPRGLLERGVYKGRARALTAEQVDQAHAWVDAGVPKAEVARRFEGRANNAV